MFTKVESTSARIDVGAADAVTVGVAPETTVDLASPAVDVAAAADLDLGTAITTDTTAGAVIESAGVQAGVGAQAEVVSTPIAVDAGVDAGGTPAIDAGVAAGPLAVDLGVGADAGTVAPTLELEVDVTEPVQPARAVACHRRGRRRTPAGLARALMSRWRRYTWPAITLLAFAAVALLRAGGQLDFLERAAVDARARLLQHEVDSDIVIVGIDAVSIAELDTWPWPRHHHARLIERLAAAGAQQVFLDIDFSSPSRELDDARLEAALGAWPGTPIILPAFLQQASGADTGVVLRRPLDRFARHVMLVSANQLLDGDSLVRRFRPTWRDGPHELPSVVRLLYPSLPDEADLADRLLDRTVVVQLRLLRRAACRTGRSRRAARPHRIRRRDRDRAQRHPRRTAVHRALPGVVVQALSPRDGTPGHRRARRRNGSNFATSRRPRRRLHARPWAERSAGVALPRRGHRHPRVADGHLRAGVLVGAALASSSQRRSLVTIAVFLVAATLRSLDEQTLRAFAYALGLRQRDALLRSIVDSSSDAILCVDASGVVRIANPASSRLFAGDRRRAHASRNSRAWCQRCGTGRSPRWPASVFGDASLRTRRGGVPGRSSRSAAWPTPTRSSTR